MPRATEHISTVATIQILLDRNCNVLQFFEDVMFLYLEYLTLNINMLRSGTSTIESKDLRTFLGSGTLPNTFKNIFALLS